MLDDKVASMRDERVTILGSETVSGNKMNLDGGYYIERTGNNHGSMALGRK